MIDYQPLYRTLTEAGAGAWVERLPDQLAAAFAADGHGDLSRWSATVAALPELTTNHRDLVNDVCVGTAVELDSATRETLKQQLLRLHPWRKGPYRIMGIHIDTEWRSDWKWNRLKQALAPLNKRLVLDVGCGNGYHCWRMLGAGARTVVGIDPTLLSVMQFHAIRKLYGEADVYVLPLAIEQVPFGLKAFDTVFSMGVLYHRRSPLDHLLELKACLRPGGELVLETLVVDGNDGQTLLPADRYAKMRNVWFLPSCPTLIAWLQRCGFVNIKLIDVCQTTTAEQRTTEWMRFHSLADFLDPDNPSLTYEGYPAPVRAILLANAPA